MLGRVCGSKGHILVKASNFEPTKIWSKHLERFFTVCCAVFSKILLPRLIAEFSPVVFRDRMIFG